MKFQLVLVLILIMFRFTISSDTTSETEIETEAETSTLRNSTSLAKPGCQSQCGDLIVHYPFGIGTNCSMNDGFQIYCDPSKRPTYFEHGYSSIKSISDSTVRLSNMLATKCYNIKDNTTSRSYSINNDFTDSPLTFSHVNTFTVIGCDDYAWLTSHTGSRNILTGCMAFCLSLEEAEGDDGDCSGNGCCQSPIPKGINYYDTQLRTLGDSGVRKSTAFNPCTYAFVGDAKELKFKGASDLNDPSFENRTEASVSIVLDWAIGNMSCEEAKKNDGIIVCEANSSCVNSTRKSGGYRCICKDRCQGNPYLKPGCQDVDECKDNATSPCFGDCNNTPGSYNCTCPSGYIGNATKENGCRTIPSKYLKIPPSTYIIIAMLFVILAILSGVGTCFGMKKRKLMRLREKFFEQNGGVLLKQKIQGSHEAITLFSTEELLKATHNCSQEHIIGRGAYGVVYKGVLSDKRVVAVKKSKLVEVTQAEQFIN